MRTSQPALDPALVLVIVSWDHVIVFHIVVGDIGLLLFWHDQNICRVGISVVHGIRNGQRDGIIFRGVESEYDRRAVQGNRTSIVIETPSIVYYPDVIDRCNTVQRYFRTLLYFPILACVCFRRGYVPHRQYQLIRIPVSVFVEYLQVHIVGSARIEYKGHFHSVESLCPSIIYETPGVVYNALVINALVPVEVDTVMLIDHGVSACFRFWFRYVPDGYYEMISIPVPVPICNVQGDIVRYRIFKDEICHHSVEHYLFSLIFE